MLQKGDEAPAFRLYAMPGQRIALDELQGKKVILAFYLANWSPVCSDQMALYNEMLKISNQDAAMGGVSVDSKWCHLAFSSLRNLHFPLPADFEPKGNVLKKYGVYDEKKGACNRALFVLDKEGIVARSYLLTTGLNAGADGISGAPDTLNK